MADLPITGSTTKTSAPSASRIALKEWTKQWPVRLLMLFFAMELLLPFLIWRGGLPRVLDFMKEPVAAAMALLVVFYMLAKDRIPRVVPVILAVTLIWGLVAAFEGQAVGATAWGWWKFFVYPLVGLFAYLVIKWPEDFSDTWLKLLIGIMAFEVLVQLIRFALGEVPGDSLAGTFGDHGMTAQTMFNLLIISLGFGHWMATRTWKLLLLALVLGLVSSMLNVTKFYIPVVVLLGIGAFALQTIRGGHVRQLFVFVGVFTVLGTAAIPLFNNFVAEERGLAPLQTYLEPGRLEQYLFNDGDGDTDGKYNLGRMLSITYAWQIIQRDPTTTLFGMGLGARSSSAGLGIEGVGLENDIYGGATGTGLLIMIQEFGVVGLVVFYAFCVVISWLLYRDTKRHRDLSLQALQFGLILYTLSWPIWLWYQKSWTFGVMMTLYWVTLGFVFSQMKGRGRNARVMNIRSDYAPAPPSLSSTGPAAGNGVYYQLPQNGSGPDYHGAPLGSSQPDDSPLL